MNNERPPEYDGLVLNESKKFKEAETVLLTALP